MLLQRRLATVQAYQAYNHLLAKTGLDMHLSNFRKPRSLRGWLTKGRERGKSVREV